MIYELLTYASYLMLEYAALGLMIGCAIKAKKQTSWFTSMRAGLLWFALIPQLFRRKHIAD